MQSDIPHRPDFGDSRSLLPLEAAISIRFPAGGVTVRTLRAEIRRGALRASKIGGRLFVSLADLDAMVEARVVAAGTRPRSPTIERREIGQTRAGEAAVQAALAVARSLKRRSTQ